MAQFKIEEILTATQGVLLQGDHCQTVLGISTDSRRVKPGELFIALKGERFDGHHFLNEVAKAGAAAVLVMDELKFNGGVAVIRVADTLKALGDIARFHRERFNVPVIGITGSNGKTTTKDLLASILEQEMPIVKTEANYNNEIGLPLTLLQITEATKAVVVEMGMRGLGQIRRLSQIAKPILGVVTNVGLTHLELLGTRQNIARAKGELVESLPGNGLAVLNGDDYLVRNMRGNSKSKTVLYGIEGDALDYRAAAIETSASGSRFKVYFNGTELDLDLPVPGRHNILNALAAMAAAKALGISNRAVQTGLAKPRLTANRLNIFTKNGFRLIDDTYNASPTSMEAALEVLVSLNQGRRIAVLADMLELGATAKEIHRRIGVYAGKSGVDYLFAYGDLAREYVNGVNDITEGKAEYFSSKQALIARLKEYIKAGDCILVKGSRGMKMEEVVTALSGGGEQG